MPWESDSNKNLKIKILAPVILVVFFMSGVFLSLHKPLWNDELHTHSWVVEEDSYSKILLGRVDEGNNNPLFYILQKGFVGLIDYHLPFRWSGQWEIADFKAQVILRVLPNLFMSLALVFIFYFFAATYGLWAGFVALFLSLCSSAVLVYWAEARPYSLWFLLTTAQWLLLLNIARNLQRERYPWKKLAFVNMCLSLTVSFGMAQTFIASVLLWWVKGKSLRHHSIVTVVPILAGLFYFLVKPNFKFHLLNPWPLILFNLSFERIVLIVLALAFGLFIFFSRKRSLGSSFFLKAESKMVVGLIVGILLATVGVISLLKIQTGPELMGFEVPARYFIYLAPAGIISIMFFLCEAFLFFKGNKWVSLNIIFIALGMMMVDLLNTVSEVIRLRIFY